MKDFLVSWFRIYKYHVLIWIIFIFYESIVIAIISGVHGNFITYAAHYLIVITLFYINAKLVLPFALSSTRKGRLGKVVFAIVLELTAFILLSFFVDSLLIKTRLLFEPEPFKFTSQYLLKTLFRDIYLIGFSTGYYFIIKYNKEKEKTNELEKQRLNDIIYRQQAEQKLIQAQNSYLKAQINPHFLFNTLDFIYHNILELSPVAADAIVILAEMMRYAIDSDHLGDFINLSDEIEQVENLLYLNNVRRDDKLNFDFKYDGITREIKLIPLVLLTLVENIFKHADLSRTEHRATVSIYLKDGCLFVETQNLINKYSTKTSNRKGLTNTEQRLKYAYKNKVDFHYKADEDGFFRVFLKIEIA